MPAILPGVVPAPVAQTPNAHDGDPTAAAFASVLNAGRAPAWLEPVQIPGLVGLHVLRVRKGAIARA